MDRRRRNQLLLRLIMVGLANFVAYTSIYWYLQGDASNGYYADGRFYLRGHFIHELSGRPSEPVPQWLWICSYLHSISIWPTIAVVLISLLILARPHIIATMKSDPPAALLSGARFVTACIVITLVLNGAITLYFVKNFIVALTAVSHGRSFGV